MPPHTSPFFVGGRPQTSPTTHPVTDPYSGKEVASFCVPGVEAVERAIEAAVAAASLCREWPAYKRRDALLHVTKRLRERQDEVAKIISVETGKPIADARSEVCRAADTFRTAAEESTRLRGEYLPLDDSPRSENFEAIVKRVPVGPCSFITPFNFPLNLAAHKAAPAIACGCPFVLKPDPRTPLSSLLLGELLLEAGLPAGSWSILPVVDDDARDLFVTDQRFRLISFTGSGPVGWDIKARAGRKKVLLELGGNAACLIDAPIGRSDLERISERLCYGAFALAGQSCISVQRVMIHQAVYEPVVAALIAKTRGLKAGSPRDESTTIGPMISPEAAARVEQWIAEAVRDGANVLTGGKRTGSFVEPTVIERVPAHSKLLTEEVFGPVVTVEPFESFDDALDLVNTSRYGLQAGIFTASMSHAFRAWNVLEVGAVIINDVPTTRVDSMPYGGVKESGLGREGVRSAIEEMTEPRALVLRNVGRRRG